MSTKNSLIVIAAIAVLAFAGMGASRLVRPQVSAQALHNRDVNAQHAEALAGAPVQSGYYGAVPQSSSRFDAAQAARQRDVVVNHSEALQGPSSSYTPWYGAISQNSPEFNAAETLQLRDLIEKHGEALQEVAP